MANANIEIREKIKAAGLYMWQVADALGIQDSNFSRLLRKELSERDRARVLAAIEKAKQTAAKDGMYLDSSVIAHPDEQICRSIL